MSHDENLSPVQFGNYTIQKYDRAYVPTVHATTKSGRSVGHLSWSNTGEGDGRPTISSVVVGKQQRGKGLAGALLQHALQYAPDLQHSHALTDDGKKFAERYPL